MGFDEKPLESCAMPLDQCSGMIGSLNEVGLKPICLMVRSHTSTSNRPNSICSGVFGNVDWFSWIRAAAPRNTIRCKPPRLARAEVRPSSIEPEHRPCPEF